MRNVATIEEIIEAYVARRPDCNRNSTGSVSRDQGTLLSYRTPIAVDGKVTLANGDRLSVTTDRHVRELQSNLQRRKVEHFTTSFSALASFLTFVGPKRIYDERDIPEEYLSGR